MFSESKAFLLRVHPFAHLFKCPALTEFPSARHGLSPGQGRGLRLKDQKGGPKLALPWGLELPGARQGGEGGPQSGQQRDMAHAVASGFPNPWADMQTLSEFLCHRKE